MTKYKYKLYGAILGDLAGQPFEFPPMKGPYTNVKLHNPKAHITDDTIMTLASANSILEGIDIEIAYKALGRAYPDAGYGKGFKAWIDAPLDTIGTSYGNGCIMRAAPFIYANDLSGLIGSVMCSHNHEDSLLAAFRLWNAYKKDKCDLFVPPNTFDKFEVNAKLTMDFCEQMFYHPGSLQRAIVKTIECGGDTDTNASIVGEYFNYKIGGITKEDAKYVESKLDKLQISILHKFNKKFK